MTTMYDLAREEYAALGIDTEAVMEKLAAKPISVHCWQGDDVLGFDQEGGLSGGIQTTGRRTREGRILRRCGGSSGRRGSHRPRY